MNKNQMNATETLLCVLTMMASPFDSKLYYDELLFLEMLRRERIKFDAKKKRKTKGR